MNNCIIGIIININELYDKIESKLKAYLLHFNTLNENILFNFLIIYFFEIIILH